ncbi:Abi family protein [Caulobacter sp. FWC2]|jgi:abortive infection bacteriophage resistance protein|uniref:Abi family protein n=1 Tax=Caulobacter sp. FWC2 TaxID=69664 RepID=UPI000C155615|nr:Abi family protein [Caulobacter sp. FWC2]PIB89965.1 DNA-binding protein [Caulobacter sp. FWC2]
MALPPYTKPHATPSDWVAHLRARGLVVPRPNVAARKIERVGYERLRIYFIARRQTHLPGKPFRAGTTYNQILNLYDCDRRLRAICFDACGDFELAFRNSMSEALTRAHGSHPHKAESAFKDGASRRVALEQLSTLYAKSRDARAHNYMAKYSDPVLPPFWTMKEFLTFGAAVRFYALLSNPIKAAVADDFGMPTHEVLTNWLECLVDLRNVCAHHDRLFNRIFQKQPSRLRRQNLPTAPVNKLKARLECLDHLLTSRGLTGGRVAAAQALLARYPDVQAAEVGY